MLIFFAIFFANNVNIFCNLSCIIVWASGWSFLWLHIILFCDYITTFKTIFLLMDTGAVAGFRYLCCKHFLNNFLFVNEYVSVSLG